MVEASVSPIEDNDLTLNTSVPCIEDEEFISNDIFFVR